METGKNEEFDSQSEQFHFGKAVNRYGYYRHSRQDLHPRYG